MEDMESFDGNTIFAVRVIPPEHPDAGYWIPLLDDELQHGRARFGWGDIDVSVITDKAIATGWDSLTAEELAVWYHAHFLLDAVMPGDGLLYMNLPVHGQHALVEITGHYSFDNVWDPQQWNDFRHLVPCRPVTIFSNDDLILFPKLRVRLGRRGAWGRIFTGRDELARLLKRLLNAA
jgi:hypothetical protein